MAARKKTSADSGGLPSLEDLLCHPQGFGLTTATPVQRAKCRIVEGRPLGALAEDPRVVKMVGGADAVAYLAQPQGKPQRVYDVSGIRGAKSLLIAALAVDASQKADLSRLGAGEIARYSILSTSIDIAQVSFNDHLVGKIMASPILKALVLDEPKSDSILLRHPSGRPVEIKVVAGARAGSTLVARWSIGLAADEAPRMHGDEAVVNFEDSVRAIEGRLLPGAQIYAPGSPWAPQGPIYAATVSRHGKPGPDLVVLRAPAYDLNPLWWTPERCAALKASNPDAYRTDVDAEFADPESAMLLAVDVEACTRQAPDTLPPVRGGDYCAAMDPATRGNAWTLVLLTRLEGRLRVALARQWVGSRAAPLSPASVLAEARALLRPYGCDLVYTDQYSSDALRDLGWSVGLSVVEKPWTSHNKILAFEGLKTRLSLRQIELPPDPQLRADLLAVRRRVTPSGISIVLPTTGDGRHADYAPALAMAASRYLDDPAPPPSPHLDDDERRFIAEQEEADRDPLAWM